MGNKMNGKIENVWVIVFGSTRYGESEKDFFGKEGLKKDPSENESCIFKFAG